MEQTKLDRINELARLAKERELTEAEQTERAALRREYIEEWRRGTIELLENTYIVTPDGVKHKLPKRGEKNAKIVRFDQINKDKKKIPMKRNLHGNFFIAQCVSLYFFIATARISIARARSSCLRTYAMRTSFLPLPGVP